MKVALRDDDTCYFTAPDELSRVYSDVWDRIPVCLATVPFAIGYAITGTFGGANARAFRKRTGDRMKRSRWSAIESSSSRSASWSGSVA